MLDVASRLTDYMTKEDYERYRAVADQVKAELRPYVALASQ